MAFMVPAIEHGEFIRMEDATGETRLFPADCLDVAELLHLARKGDVTLAVERGFFARLSAPGYMDATDWQGPYATEAAAMADLCETYDVDEDGEDVDEDDDV